MIQATILVDADACPVKEEIYKVAYRTRTPVQLVSNSYLRIPDHPLISQSVVHDGFDAADDAIVEQADRSKIVVTSDILLADRAIKAGALVITPKGQELDGNSIGSAVATRALMADLRAGGDQMGGPSAFTKTDRSRFLTCLDAVLTRLQRKLQS